MLRNILIFARVNFRGIWSAFVTQALRKPWRFQAMCDGIYPRREETRRKYYYTSLHLKVLKEKLKLKYSQHTFKFTLKVC